MAKTIVGNIHPEVLAFTAGKDVELDHALIEFDCIGTAAHVTMLSRMKMRPAIITPAQAAKVKKELLAIIKLAEAGKFRIKLQDQDVHLAVEKALTAKLGDLGKKVHTGRSRNDQVALDLRLYARSELLGTIAECLELINALVKFGKRHVSIPMVGRTHMMPAMPSSVGLWATAFAESLLDDVVLLVNAYELNDKSPLGSAAGYGVPLPIDRTLVADLLGFTGTCHNVIYAGQCRGKMESIVLNAYSQVMLTLSRLAQDLMLFTMPEFGYFKFSPELGTGSSIMPQKNNPDVLELVRAKSARVQADAVAVYDLVKALPSGYNRDLQEAKEPFMHGISVTRESLNVMRLFVEGVTPVKKALQDGFHPAVFATDEALRLVAGGVPFRDAYAYVKDHIDELGQMDPRAVIATKTHEGATAGLDFDGYTLRIKEGRKFVKDETGNINRSVSKLLGIRSPGSRAK